MTERLLVVGGDAGGMAAASVARRRAPNLSIVAVERGRRTSYSACGIPYLVGGDVDAPDDLVARTPDEFRNNQRIDVRMGHEVTGLDLSAGRAEVRDLARGRTLGLDWDQVLLATGASPIRPDLPGIDADWVRGVQTVDDGADLLARARDSHCRDVVVVGAGYIGLEMAEAFHRWGARVTLVEANDTPMSRTIDPDMGEPICQRLSDLGVDLRFGVRVEGFEDGRVLTDHDRFRADLAVLGLGVGPNNRLAADAGIGLGPRGAIAVDRRQRTDTEGVWSAGDCADTFHRVSQRRVHVALGTVANKTSRVAGTNIAGGYARFAGVVGTAITKVCDLGVARTGLTSAEAERAGFCFTTATITSTVAAGYMPGDAAITVKLLAEDGTGRLLGGQIVGHESGAKRIDTLAAAITGDMTAADLVEMDLSYAPPFSPVWDPVQVAARKLA